MKNEYALVTGAGKRVGSFICKFLALQGYHVITVSYTHLTLPTTPYV